MEKKQMARCLNWGSCPNCGARKFIVNAMSINNYLTNDYGEVIDSVEISYDAKGICTTCNRVFEMAETTYGFIPMTPLRKILNYAVPVEDKIAINNPISKEKE